MIDFCVCVVGALGTLAVVMKEICHIWSNSKCSACSREHPFSPAMRVPIPCLPQRQYRSLCRSQHKCNTNTDKIKSKHFPRGILLFLLPPVALKFKDAL